MNTKIGFYFIFQASSNYFNLNLPQKTRANWLKLQEHNWNEINRKICVKYLELSGVSKNLQISSPNVNEYGYNVLLYVFHIFFALKEEYK